MTGWLRDLLAQTTPGPWELGTYEDTDEREWPWRVYGASNFVCDFQEKTNLSDALLIELAPNLAQLVADMAHWIAVVGGENPTVYPAERQELEARLESLRPGKETQA